MRVVLLCGGRSQEWNYIDESERRALGLTFGHDGEFWMSFTDFTKNFQKLEIVHLGVEMMADDDVKWSCNQMDGGWNRRVSAGGCRNYLGTPRKFFASNFGVFPS